MSLLITSFAPWRAHQSTNASDDLVVLLQQRRRLPQNTQVIRHLPVHDQLAPCRVLSAMLKQRPSAVVCCGMAERRSLLNVERYAHHQGHQLETSINLPQLCAATQWTEISHDAGDYVCNDLYYRLLVHVNQHRLPIFCLFVHLPPINQYNREPLVHDLAIILSRLANMQQEISQLEAA